MCVRAYVTIHMYMLSYTVYTYNCIPTLGCELDEELTPRRGIALFLIALGTNAIKPRNRRGKRRDEVYKQVGGSQTDL